MRTLTTALALLLGCLTISCRRSGNPEFILTYSVFFPSSHIHARLASQWAEEIGRSSNGRLRIDVYPGGVLSGANENYECVVSGVSDLGMSCFAYTRGLFPMLEGADLPWGYKSGRQATQIVNAYYQRFRPAELNEVEVMYLHAHGPGVLASRKRVAAFADLAGLSIRGTGISAQMVRNLRGNPVGMSQGDTYDALRKGVVDATLCPIETLKGWKQGEVIDYVTRIPAAGYTTAMFVVMNKKTWNRLPPDLQKIIQDTNAEWIDQHGRAWDQADRDGENFVTTLGKEILNLPADQNALVSQALTPMLRGWADKLDGNGQPGADAFSFLQQQVTASPE